MLLLSKLALMEPYIEPPRPKIKPVKANKDIKKPEEQGRMQIKLDLKKLTMSVNDISKANFFVVETEI